MQSKVRITPAIFTLIPCMGIHLEVIAKLTTTLPDFCNV